MVHGGGGGWRANEAHGGGFGALGGLELSRRTGQGGGVGANEAEPC